MLQSLHIKNFGPHENVKLDFHPGINIIIGEGCAGKSWIVRALRLLRYYRPSHFRYHSNFSQDNFTKIKAIFSDCVVQLHKTKKDAKYTVDNEEFRKFKTTVPDAVVNALNLDDINFQFQLDQPFIISETPGRITKIINDITKISHVNEWISKLNSLIKNDSVILDSTKEEYKEARSQLKALKELDDIKRLLNKYNETNRKIEDLKNQNDDIQEAINDIRDAERNIEQLQKSLRPLENFSKKILYIIEQIEEKKNTIDDIKDYIDDSYDLVKLNKSLRRMINQYIKILKRQKKCPTCFSKITIKCIGEILNDLKKKK